MTNFEKLQRMNERYFSAAIAATVGAFRHKTDKYLGTLSVDVWVLAFADWFRAWVNAPYDGEFDDADDPGEMDIMGIIDEALKSALEKNRRKNSSKEGTGND